MAELNLVKKVTILAFSLIGKLANLAKKFAWRALKCLERSNTILCNFAQRWIHMLNEGHVEL